MESLIAHTVVHLRIDDILQRGDFREFLRQHLQNAAALRIQVGDDQNHHQFARGGHADNQVAQQPLMGTEIVERKMVIDCELLDCQANCVARIGLQPAFVYIQHLVKLARHMESQPTNFNRYAVLLLLHILHRQPPLMCEGEFQFVAIKILIFGS